MANLPPQSPSMKKDKSNSSSSSINSTRMMYAKRLVIELNNPDLRENALTVLSKMTDLFQELASVLWNSFGIIATFLQEITSIYPVISTPDLTPQQSARVCNVLALLQCVASHYDTKISFLKANMPIYLYPYLRTTNNSAPYEDLRLASLGVIAATVKVKTREAIDFLLASEVMPLCLQSIDVGRELSKTVATFIVEKILSDHVGMAYVCVIPERYHAVIGALDMLAKAQNQPSSRLVKLLVSCYTYLSEKQVMFLPKTIPPPS
ncbi:CCR4-NOT transcription complex subunit 9-like [Trifolium pratense]|uniref:CCR4-NOT transcription complex subunit 9-like n=1 Tax=Trifolium pratense TaxID=57577 RepID=UPI001E697F38|nr:CCR4-NOT transcription complex subunit 9-like [Trifolium pratense]